MLTVEEFTTIADANSEEERRILCGIHDISYETFSKLWPIEKFGRAALEHDIILLQVEHVFQANSAFFDLYDKGPRMSHSLVITYTTPISDSIYMSMLNSEYHESRIEVNWLEVTPSLEKAIYEALKAGRG
jgi:hypothetical protein